MQILREATARRRAAAGRPPVPTDPATDRRTIDARESPVSRLSQLAVSKRSVTLLLAAALFIAGDLGLGQPQAGTPAGHRVPDRHRRRGVSRRRLVRCRRAGDQAHRERHLRRAAPRCACSPRRPTRSRSSSPSSPYGTNVKEATAAIEEGIAKAGPARGGRPDDLGPEHQRHAGRHLLDRLDDRGRPGCRRRDRPHRDRARDLRHRRRRPGRPGRWPRGAPRGHARSRQARRLRRLHAADRRHPPGQQSDVPIRRSCRATGRARRSPRSDDSPRSRRSRTSSSGTPTPAAAGTAGRAGARHVPGALRRRQRRPSRSPWATSARSRSTPSPRPASAGPTASRR